MDLVPLKDCIKGRVYRVQCRNLVVGVFDGHEGFIGIRIKFGSRFLFPEYHWEQGAPHGTVSGAVDLGIDVPDEIEVVTHIDTIDKTTGRSLVRDENTENPNRTAKGLRGWWRYADTNEIAPTVDNGLKPAAVHNDALFAFLEKIEKEQGVTSNERRTRKT